MQCVQVCVYLVLGSWQVGVGAGLGVLMCASTAAGAERVQEQGKDRGSSCWQCSKPAELPPVQHSAMGRPISAA